MLQKKIRHKSTTTLLNPHQWAVYMTVSVCVSHSLLFYLYVDVLVVPSTFLGGGKV